MQTVHFINQIQCTCKRASSNFCALTCKTTTHSQSRSHTEIVYCYLELALRVVIFCPTRLTFSSLEGCTPSHTPSRECTLVERIAAQGSFQRLSNARGSKGNCKDWSSPCLFGRECFAGEKAFRHLKSARFPGAL